MAAAIHTTREAMARSCRETALELRRLSALASAGAAGSHQVRLAEGLLADTETRVIYGQPSSEVEAAKELLGLSDTEAKLLTHLPRGAGAVEGR